MFTTWRLTLTSPAEDGKEEVFNVSVNPVERVIAGVQEFNNQMDIPLLARWSLGAAVAGMAIPSAAIILAYATDDRVAENIARRKANKAVGKRYPGHTIDWNHIEE